MYMRYMDDKSDHCTWRVFHSRILIFSNNLSYILIIIFSNIYLQLPLSEKWERGEKSGFDIILLNKIWEQVGTL